MRILDRITWSPIKITILYFFKFTGIDSSKLKPRFAGEIRWGDHNDIPGIMECIDKPSKEILFRKRLSMNDKCFVAIDDNGNTAGYGWLTLKNSHLEEKTQCLFEFPAGSIYTYDIYIDPNYRLTGIWVGFMQLILKSEHYNPDGGLYCSIAYGNLASLKPHIRYGFKVYLRKTIVTIFQWPISINKTLEHSDAVIKQVLIAT